jgi:hypothetical protein
MRVLPILRFATLLLAALGLSLGAAHALELGPKMAWGARTYATVTSTLYRNFGLVGGPVQVLAALAAIALAIALRGRRSFRLTAAGAALLVVSLVLWAALVQPVNSEWARVLAAGDDEAVVAAYSSLRERWEYGHVAAFVAWLAGFAALSWSAVADGGERASS